MTALMVFCAAAFPTDAASATAATKTFQRKFMTLPNKRQSVGMNAILRHSRRQAALTCRGARKLASGTAGRPPHPEWIRLKAQCVMRALAKSLALSALLGLSALVGLG